MNSRLEAREFEEAAARIQAAARGKQARRRIREHIAEQPDRGVHMVAAYVWDKVNGKWPSSNLGMLHHLATSIAGLTGPWLS